jgi:Tfp pilus assembly protein PilX
MNKLRAIFRDEGGVAIVLAMVVLLALSTLVVAFLAVSAFEPQISANLTAATQARYVAEAGIEAAFDYLAINTDWSAALAAAGATCATGGVVPTTTQNNALPGLNATSGTFTVRVRNDCLNGDTLVTGAALDTANGGGATTDKNNRLILTSTGTLGTATKTIKVILRKATLPTINAALAFPGVNADVDFSGSSFTIRGVDTQMGSQTADGTGNPVYGISVGESANEAGLDSALANNQQNSVSGLSQSDPNATTTGNGTVAFDTSLTREAVTDFVNAIKGNADIAINAPNGSGFTIQNIGESCSTNVNSSSCWGTTTNPKIVYVKGNATSTSSYTALDISGNSTGTGILIVESGGVDITGNFQWNGPIIITGTGVKLRYHGGGDQSIWGSVIVNELASDGVANLEADISGNAKIFYSTQALNLVMNALGGRKAMNLYSWQEQ